MGRVQAWTDAIHPIFAKEVSVSDAEVFYPLGACAILWVFMILYHLICVIIQPKEREKLNVRETQVQDVIRRLEATKSFQFFPTTREEWREWDKFPEPPLGAPSAGPPGEEVADGSWQAMFFLTLS